MINAGFWICTGINVTQSSLLETDTSLLCVLYYFFSPAGWDRSKQFSSKKTKPGSYLSGTVYASYSEGQKFDPQHLQEGLVWNSEIRVCWQYWSFVSLGIRWALFWQALGSAENMMPVFHFYKLCFYFCIFNILYFNTVIFSGWRLPRVLF